MTLGEQSQSVDNVLRRLQSASADCPRLAAKNQAAWTRVTVFAREQPLGEVLTGVAHLFNYTWNQGEGPGEARTNALAQSGRARAYEERLWREQMERAGRPLFALAGYTQKPATTWATLQKTRAAAGAGAPPPDDPLLRAGNLKALSLPHLHAALALLSTLSRQQRGALLENEQVILPPQSISARQWRLVRQMHTSPGPHYDYYERPLSEEAYRRLADTRLAFFEAYGVPLKISRNPVTGAVSGYAAFYSLGHIPLEEQSFPVRGNPYPPPDQLDTLAPRYEDLERTPFPAAFKVPAAAAQEPSWPDLVAELAKHLPTRALFSDDFAGARSAGDTLSPETFPKLGEMNLAQGLDALCAAYGRLWWRDGNKLFFRSRTWFVEQRYEVPPPLLEQLFQQISAMRTENASEALLTLSALTREQLQGLNGVSAVLRRRAAPAQSVPTLRRRLGLPFLEANNAYRYLQLFRTLDAGQQLRALGKDGLSWEQMTLAQQQALLSYAVGFLGAWVAQDVSKLRLKVEPQASTTLPAPSPAPAASEATASLRVSFGFLPNASHSSLTLRLSDTGPSTKEATDVNSG